MSENVRAWRKTKLNKRSYCPKLDLVQAKARTRLEKSLSVQRSNGSIQNVAPNIYDLQDISETSEAAAFWDVADTV